jgi:hypothetical protein
MTEVMPKTDIYQCFTKKACSSAIIAGHGGENQY